MIRPLLALSLFLALPTFVRSVSAAEPVVVEGPEEGSRMKLLDFSGGNPQEFLAQVKKTYGGFGMVVTMEDETGGVPLPAGKVFADSPSQAIQLLLGDRVSTSALNGWWKMRFLAPKNKPGANSPEAAATQDGAERKPILFQFPGGTPVELLAALDQAFGSRLSEVATIFPQISASKLPPLHMRASDAVEVLEMLNAYSQSSAGAAGRWQCLQQAYDSADTAAETNAVLFTPLYNDDNPSPSAAAREATVGEVSRALRKVGEALQRVESSTSQTNGTLQQVQDRLGKLETKNP